MPLALSICNYPSRVIHKVDLGIATVLPEPKIGRKNSHRSVCQTRLGNGAVLDALSVVGSKEGPFSALCCNTWHVLIQSTENSIDPGFQSKPIGLSIALKTQMRFQDVVEQIGILGRIGIVHRGIACHDAGGIGTEGFSVGPKVNLVECLAVHVAGIVSAIILLAIVANVLLDFSLYTSPLMAMNGLVASNADQVWVIPKAFEIGATTNCSCKSQDGAEDGVDALGLQLLGDSKAASSHELPVPC